MDADGHVEQDKGATNDPDKKIYIRSWGKKINRSHTHTQTENTTPDTQDKKNTSDPQTNPPANT